MPTVSPSMLPARERVILSRLGRALLLLLAYPIILDLVGQDASRLIPLIASGSVLMIGFASLMLFLLLPLPAGYPAGLSLRSAEPASCANPYFIWFFYSVLTSLGAFVLSTYGLLSSIPNSGDPWLSSRYVVALSWECLLIAAFLFSGGAWYSFRCMMDGRFS